jgi:hypothetical protein
MSADRSAAGIGRWAGTLGGRIIHWAGTLTGRVLRVWRVLPHERRLAAFGAVGLFVTLFLPWYQETVIVPGSKGAASANASVTGWAAFSFVEAAVLLVAAGVLTLLFQRAEGRAFHLPGGDGWVITAAGGWACVLVIWRIFDKQTASVHGPGVSISGIEWGIFVALAGAAFLTYAGSRIRAAHQPEPPLPGDEPAEVPGADRDVAVPRPRRARRPAPVRAPVPVPEDGDPVRRAAPDWGPTASDELAGPAASKGREGPSAARPFFERPPGWLTARPDHLGPPEFDDLPTRRGSGPPGEAPERRPSDSPAPPDDAPARRPSGPADEAPTRRDSRPVDSQPAPYAADPPPEAPLPPSTPAARRQQSDEQLTIPLEPED